MAIPLPPNPFPPSAFHAVYERCLALGAAAPNLQALSHCPPPIGQIQHEITSAEEDANLMELAQHYLTHFLNAFKRRSGPTPVPSEHPSRPSLEDARQYSKAIIEEGTLDHRTAQAYARRRDDNCCMLTGDRDCSDGGLLWVDTVHIIPEATNRSIGKEGKEQFHSGGVWTIPSIFTDVDIVDMLAGKLIHRLENIMSMKPACHRAFDELFLWLKLIEGSPHTYRVCEARQGLKMRLSIPDIVTFSTVTEYPLPHPAFLALHALCCEVVWVSGAAEYIMDMERRMDETSVLANDGSTAAVLMRALALVET